LGFPFCAHAPKTLKGRLNSSTAWVDARSWGTDGNEKPNEDAMSPFGPKRTSVVAPHMSAFGGKADITV